MMNPWFSKMKPRETYWETTLKPMSPVMQDSLTASTGFFFASITSLPAKACEANPRMLAVRTQNLAILFLVIDMGLCWFGVRVRRGAARPDKHSPCHSHFFLKMRVAPHPGTHENHGKTAVEK